MMVSAALCSRIRNSLVCSNEAPERAIQTRLETHRNSMISYTQKRASPEGKITVRPPILWRVTVRWGDVPATSRSVAPQGLKENSHRELAPIFHS